MYPRLRLARNLLRDDGVIFISIDNNEIHNLKAICNEIFGEENFVECITWNKRIPKNDKGIGSIHEYILIYVKNNLIRHEFVMRKEGLEEIDDLVQKLKRSKTPLADSEVELKKLYNKKGYDRGITLYNSLDENYKLWGKINMSWPNSDTFGPRYTVLHPKTNKPVKVPDRGWRWKEDTFDEAAQIINGKYQNIKKLHDGTYMCGRIWFDKDEKIQPSSINYLEEVDTFLLRSILSLKSDGGIEVEELFEGKSYFSYPKPTELLKILFKSIPNERNDIYLDFFAGSGTTAQAILEINQEDNGGRKFILVQLPEPVDKKSEAFKMNFKNISDITKERIKKVIAIQKKKESVSKADLGFKVFKLINSNYKPWKNYEGQSVEEIEKQFSLFETPLVGGWKAPNLLYEILLLEGFPLDSKVELQKEYKKNKINQVASDVCQHKLLVSFDKIISPETIVNLRLNEGDIFICLDSAITDQDKVRLSDKGLIKTI
jgi:adenine-specific DNA-methyltransferase